MSPPVYPLVIAQVSGVVGVASTSHIFSADRSGLLSQSSPLRKSKKRKPRTSFAKRATAGHEGGATRTHRSPLRMWVATMASPNCAVSASTTA